MKSGKREVIWVFGGLLAAGGLFMGIRIYRELKVLGLLPAFLAGSPPAQAKSAFTPMAYPLEVAAPATQDIGAWTAWYDPAQVTARAKAYEEAHRLLGARAWQAAKGDPAQAVAALVAESHTPDGAQALLWMLRDLAVQGSERAATERQRLEAEVQKAKEEAAAKLQTAGGAEARQAIVRARDEELARLTARRPGPPVFPLPAGQPGIEAVAKATKALAGRRASGTQGPFDAILLPEALRLLAYHGASEVPEARKQATLDGKGTAAPVNGVVKTLLRTLFAKDPDLQPFASKALGQLGDAETARELAEHPHKYPGASIADFGPEAVQLFKEKRIARLQKGAGSEEAAFVSLRLGFRDREAAFDLAKAGDWGAGLAYERSLALENLYSKEKPDDRYARYLDTYLRFPNTRQAEQAAWALTADSGLEFLFGDSGHVEEAVPKTMDLLLRYFEMAMRRTFIERRPMDMEPVLDLNILTAAWHFKKYKPYRWKSHQRFFTALDELFRRYFPAGKNLQQINTIKRRFLSLTRTNTYALHVGLKMIKIGNTNGMDQIRAIVMESNSWKIGKEIKTPDDIMQRCVGINHDTGWGVPGACVALGHFRKEDL